MAFRWQFEFNLSPSRGLRAAFRVHELELESSFPNLRLTESLTHIQLELDSEVTGHCRGAARRRYAARFSGFGPTQNSGLNHVRVGLPQRRLGIRITFPHPVQASRAQPAQ